MIKSESLKYDDFKKEVMEKFQKYFPEERQLVYSQVRKNNAVKDSVALRIDGIEGINATIVIYIQDMYNCYLHDEIDMHKFLEKMASILMEDDDWLLFGYMHIFEWEWGYVLLSELQSIRLPYGLTICMEANLHMTVKQLLNGGF